MDRIICSCVESEMYFHTEQKWKKKRKRKGEAKIMNLSSNTDPEYQYSINLNLCALFYFGVNFFLHLGIRPFFLFGI